MKEQNLKKEKKERNADEQNGKSGILRNRKEEAEIRKMETTRAEIRHGDNG